MKAFQTVFLLVMAVFFLWLLLQMSRTPDADRRLAAMGLAFVSAFAALGFGAWLGGRSQDD